MPKPKSDILQLSASTGISLYVECKQCFWLLQNKGIKRPQGIFASLPIGMDSLIKKHYDNFRGKLPPELIGKLEGTLHPDQETIKKWRNWRSGLSIELSDIKAKCTGALDDCIIENNKYVPLDYKTRSSPPEEGYAEKYYQNQLNIYVWMLRENGHPTPGYAYLVYYTPAQILMNNPGMFRFETTLVKISTDADKAKELFKEAVACARDETMPESSENCEWCAYRGGILV